VLVLALGNPILCDDGVAFHVLDHIRACLPEGDDLVLEEASTGGIDLLNHVIGFDKVLLIDAIKTAGGEPGQVRTFDEGDFKETLHASSTHSVNFSTAMELGRALRPGQMPAEIAILAIEAGVVDCFDEELTPEVREAVPKAASAALGILRGWGIGVDQGPMP